ncbi:MAG TPA: glycogen synthase [Actinomycetales bacterium]|nr:glycogen synthase [Actinomycetales bacterium]
MRIDMLTREYPPHIYGGAGVHVTELAAVLGDKLDVRIRCLDGPREEAKVTGYSEPQDLKAANPTLATLDANLYMAKDCAGADLGHSHTWYANFAGHTAGLLHGIPHVISAHSLEPLRPWKAEQLGGGYRVSSFIERSAYLGADAVIAVSAGMRADVLRSYPEIDPEKVRVVHNGIDLAGWQRREDPDTVRRWGIDPDQPAVVFVGRITRQKGLPYLLRAAQQLPPEVQLVLCAGAPDTAELMAEVQQLVADLRAEREGVVWIDEMLPREELTAILSAATTFVCPSVYEPLGIVNLEAMACGTPVVGSGTGGIPEVVTDGEVGTIVPIEQVSDGTGEPIDPHKFVSDLAQALTEMVADPHRARAMGEAARKRVEDHFSWEAIAERTIAVYESVLHGSN